MAFTLVHQQISDTLPMAYALRMLGGSSRPSLARCSSGLFFFVMSDAYATRLRCIFVFSFTKKTYLHRVNDGDVTSPGSNNNNNSASAYANSSAMKKPIFKHRSISEMLTGALQLSTRSGSPGAVANGLVGQGGAVGR